MKLKDNNPKSVDSNFYLSPYSGAKVFIPPGGKMNEDVSVFYDESDEILFEGNLNLDEEHE